MSDFVLLLPIIQGTGHKRTQEDAREHRTEDRGRDCGGHRTVEDRGHRAQVNIRLRRIEDTGHRAPEDTRRRTETRTRTACHTSDNPTLLNVSSEPLETKTRMCVHVVPTLFEQTRARTWKTRRTVGGINLSCLASATRSCHEPVRVCVLLQCCLNKRQDEHIPKTWRSPVTRWPPSLPIAGRLSHQ